MATENDTVGVNVKAQLDAANNSGALKAETKSRFIAAADRLLGALFDLPAKWLDTKAENIEHEAELKRKLKEAMTAPVIEAAEAGQFEEARILSLRVATEYREIERTINLAGVVQKATIALTDASDAPENDVEVEWDEEWLARFQLYAASATTDEMRTLWARVLANETRQPGSFGASSLRFVFELDNSLAEICEQFARRTVRGNIYRTSEDRAGESLNNALTLQAAGLLTAVGADLSSTLGMQDGNVIRRSMGDYALVASMANDYEVHVPVWVVTKLGEEIFSLLPQGSAREKLKSLGNAIIESVSEDNELAFGKSNKIESLELHRLGQRKEGGREVLETEHLLVDQKNQTTEGA